MAMCSNHPEATAVAFCRECGKPLCAVCKNESLGAIYCAAHNPAVQTVTPPPPPTNPSQAWDWTKSPGASPYAGKSYSSSPYTSAYPSATYEAPPADIPPVGNVPPPGAGLPYTAPAYAAPSGHPSGSPALALMLGTIPGVGAIYNGQYAKGLVHAVIFGLLITIVSNENSALAPLVGILIGVWWFYMVIEAFHTARKRHNGIPVDEFSSLVSLRSTAFPVGAVVLIGLGGILLLNTSGLLPIERVLRFWPLGLILAGVYMLYARLDRAHSTPVTTSLPQEFIDERR